MKQPLSLAYLSLEIRPHVQSHTYNMQFEVWSQGMYLWYMGAQLPLLISFKMCISWYIFWHLGARGDRVIPCTYMCLNLACDLYSMMLVSRAYYPTKLSQYKIIFMRTIISAWFQRVKVELEIFDSMSATIVTSLILSHQTVWENYFWLSLSHDKSTYAQWLSLCLSIWFSPH